MSPIIKHFFIYASSALMLRGASVIIAPLTLHLLSPAEYGLQSLLHSFASIVTILIGFGLRQVLSIEFFHVKGAQQQLLIHTILCAYVVLATPLFLAALCCSHLINRAFFSGAATTYLIIITLCYCFIYFFVELVYQILRYQEKVRLVTLLQTSTSLIILISNSLLLFWFRAGVSSSMTSFCIGYAVLCLWAAYAYYKSHYKTAVRLRESCKRIPTYLIKGLPFIPTVLCSWVLSSSDRWLLAHLTTLHEVGIYALADTFGQLYLVIILQPLSHAYLPQLMHAFANPQTRYAVEQQNRTRALKGMGFLMLLISSGFLIIKPLWMLLLPASYHNAYTSVWGILMGYIFLTGSYAFSALIQFYQCRWFLSLSLFLPAVCNFILNLFFIPLAGVQGCVLATVCAQALYCGTTYWYGSRLLKGLVNASCNTQIALAGSRE